MINATWFANIVVWCVNKKFGHNPQHYFTGTGIMIPRVDSTTTLKYMGNIAQTAPLTHRGRDKMDAISPMTFSSAFSWMKMFEFRLKFHWSFFPKGPINNIPALVPIMAWRIYASLGLNELIFQTTIPHKPRQVRWGELHASVGTEWSPACLH